MENWVISILALLVSLSSFLWTFFRGIAELRERVRALEEKFDLFYEILRERLAQSLFGLHNPITDEMRALMERFLKREINPEEVSRLMDYLDKTLAEVEPQGRELCALCAGRLFSALLAFELAIQKREKRREA